MGELEVKINASRPQDLKDMILTLDNFFNKKTLSLESFFKPMIIEPEKKPSLISYSFFTLRNFIWIIAAVLIIGLIVCGYWYRGYRRERLR